MNQPYTHSGSMGQAPWMVPLLGGIAALFFGWIYAYICVYSPIAGYISFIFVLGFMFVVGFAVSQFGVVAKCRNPMAMKLLGGLVGSMAMYASWVVFVYALLNRFSEEDPNLSLVGMFFQPAVLWEVVGSINESGWYSIKSFTPTGGVLWFLWGVEAVVVIGGSALMADMMINDKVFCEHCNTWLEEDDPTHLAQPQAVELSSQVKAGNIDALEQLGVLSSDQYPRYDLTTLLCPNCGKTTAFKMDEVTATVDNEGKSSTDSNSVIPLTTISNTAYTRLKQLATA